MAYEIIDLTYPIEEGMLTFGAPWHVPVSITQLGRIGVEGRETRKITLGTHTGTQVDAPLHFIKDGQSIDLVSLDILFGPVSIFDFTHLGEDATITSDILSQLNLSKRILFRFGREKYWNNRTFYKGYPHFSIDAAHYLVEKGVQLIGLDSPSPDDGRTQLSGDLLGSEKDSPIHKILMSHGVIIVEYLANMDKIHDLQGWSIAAMPLKIKGADGAPARICLFR